MQVRHSVAGALYRHPYTGTLTGTRTGTRTGTLADLPWEAFSYEKGRSLAEATLWFQASNRTTVACHHWLVPIAAR